MYSKKPFFNDDCKRTSGSTEPEIEQCTGGKKARVDLIKISDALSSKTPSHEHAEY